MSDPVSSNRIARIEVASNASDDEVAAITAAVQLLWPEPSSVQSEPVISPWRYSGRHWEGSAPSWRLSLRH